MKNNITKRDIIEVLEDGKRVCIVSNALTRGRFELHLTELRLIMYAINKVKINENQDWDTADPHRLNIAYFTANELLTVLGVGEKNHEYLRNALRGLKSRVIEFYKGDRWHIYSWFETAWIDKDGSVMIRFSNDLAPHISALENQFTRLALDHMLGFKSMYSARLYMISKSWVTVGKYRVEIADLKYQLKIEKKYRAHKDFWGRVIVPAVREINKLSDIRIDVSVVKETRVRRAYKHLDIIVQPAPVAVQTLLAAKTPPPKNTFAEKQKREEEIDKEIDVLYINVQNREKEQWDKLSPAEKQAFAMEQDMFEDQEPSTSRKRTAADDEQIARERHKEYLRGNDQKIIGWLEDIKNLDYEKGQL